MTFSNFNTVPSTNPLNTQTATPVFTIFAARDPSTTDNAYQPATEWQNTVTGQFWKLESTGQSATWVAITGATASSILSITPDSGSSVVPNGSGAVAITGSTTGLTTSGSGSTLSLAGTLNVAHGGTGATSLTGLVIGNGTSAMTALGAATNGQIPIGSTGFSPVLATITAGSGISVTNGAGSITLAVNGSSVGQTITAQSGGALSPTAGNWNIYGAGETTTSGSGSTLSILAPRPYKAIVDPTLNYGTYQTIAAAVAGTSANDTIFIRPGTYVEDITLTSNRYFVGSVQGEGSTIIQGKISDGGNTIVLYLQNLYIKTNGDYCLSLSGNSSYCFLSGVQIRGSNNTAIQISNATATVNGNNCTGNLDTTGIALWSSSGAILFQNSKFDNSGGSSTSSANSGNTFLLTSGFSSPISCSGSGTISLQNTIIDTSLVNATAVTTAGTGASQIYNSSISSGSGACVSVGSGTSVTIANSECSSSTTNVLTGAGTLFYGNIVFTGSSNGHNVTTETALSKLG